MISINNLKVFRQERAIPTGTCMSEFHGQRFRNLKFKNSNKDIKDTFGDSWGYEEPGLLHSLSSE
jgi:hypothetical protein